MAADLNPEAPVALVTGGTRNIGRAIALRLGADGYRVGIAYRSNADAAAATLAELGGVAQDSAAWAADLTDDAAAAVLVAKAVERWGRLDVLVNAVGPMIVAAASDTDPAAFRAMVDGNLLSAYGVTRHALAHLRAAGGNVVMLGSLNAELARGASDHAAYNMSKTALIVWARSLARSEGPRGVRVNVVCPGLLDTPDTPDDVRSHMPARVPLGRLGRPEEVAEAVAFLASDRAAYVSGAVLNVSGGLWA
jgi:3-oxoacyl-[acyl-carrier protein] reductase